MSIPHINPQIPKMSYHEMVKTLCEAADQGNLVISPQMIAYLFQGQMISSQLLHPLYQLSKEGQNENLQDQIPHLLRLLKVPQIASQNPSESSVKKPLDLAFTLKIVKTILKTIQDPQKLEERIAHLLNTLKNLPKEKAELESFFKGHQLIQKQESPSLDKQPIPFLKNGDLGRKEGEKALLPLLQKIAVEKPSVNSPSLKVPTSPALEISSKERLSFKQNSPPVITHIEELHSFVQAHPPAALNLPLTFVVPYPFERSINPFPFQTKKTSESSKSLKKKREEEKEQESQIMAFIPKGPVDPEGENSEEIASFAIAITPVTNAQFAHWLNDAFKQQQITLDGGAIRDLKGHLICLTKEKRSTSQIQIAFQEGELQFKPVKHTDHHPVVHVTYRGAAAFCHNQGFRLPTEAEWERAAGVTPSIPTQPTKRFQFGIGSDEIDVRFANYRDQFTVLNLNENKTTPVGFYNGESLFAKGYQTIKTELAISPFGCFDMSGNVREWVEEQVTKGGSYDSPLQELAISARTSLDSLTADAYTGFRVALSI